MLACLGVLFVCVSMCVPKVCVLLSSGLAGFPDSPRTREQETCHYPILCQPAALISAWADQTPNHTQLCFSLWSWLSGLLWCNAVLTLTSEPRTKTYTMLPLKQSGGLNRRLWEKEGWQWPTDPMDDAILRLKHVLAVKFYFQLYWRSFCAQVIRWMALMRHYVAVLSNAFWSTHLIPGCIWRAADIETRTCCILEAARSLMLAWM